MLEGRTILIVGSTAGIGADVYRLCIQQGARTIGVGRNRERGESMAAELGGRFIQADLGSEADVEDLFASLIRDGTRINGAVNNAAVTQGATPIDEMPLSEFDRLLSINVRGTWLCLAREMAAMREKGGAIVNVASIAGKRGFPGLSAYCASKHAVIGMTRAAALDGAPSGIRVNAVLPGTTRTEMLDVQMRTRPGGLEGTVQRIPLGRVSEPREQAEAIVWLLSSASSFVSGECLTVDGGTSVKC